MIENYKSQFKLISNKVRGLFDSQYLIFFLGRLKKKIKIRVRMINPHNLVVAYRLARM
jgi:hypothetical protein